MTTHKVILTVIIDENRQIVIDLPDDIPAGPAQLEINIEVVDPDNPLTSEEVRHRLIAAGLINPNTRYAAPTHSDPPTGKRLTSRGSAKSSDDVVNEEREGRH